MWQTKISASGRTVRHIINCEHFKMKLCENPGFSSYLLSVRLSFIKPAIIRKFEADSLEEAKTMATSYTKELILWYETQAKISL